jgi:hypothetical protein
VLWRKKPKDQPNAEGDVSKDDPQYRWDDDQWRVPPYKHWEAGNSDYEADERNFWQHQVRALWANVGIGIATLTAAGAAAIIAYGAYQAGSAAVVEAKKQTTEAHRQADAAINQLAIQSSDQRPWLHLEDVKTEVINYTANGLYFTMRFIGKNYGHSPAIHAHIRATVVPFKFDVSVEEKALCENYDFQNKSGPVVFTGEPKEFPVTLTFYKDDIARQRAMDDAQGSKMYSIWMTVLACVQYESLYDTQIHHEGHAYNLNPVDITNAADGTVLSAPNGHPSFLTPGIID